MPIFTSCDHRPEGGLVAVPGLASRLAGCMGCSRVKLEGARGKASRNDDLMP